LTIAIPARHPLLAFKQIPLAEALNYPLILFHPDTHTGLHQQIYHLLRQIPLPVMVAEQVSSHEVMLRLVAAGYGIGLTTEAQMVLCQHTDIFTRSLAGDPPLLTSYLLRSSNSPSEPLKRFTARAIEMEESL
jgi:DNA-binding transcriptional LysR family regulator